MTTEKPTIETDRDRSKQTGQPTCGCRVHSGPGNP